VEDLDVDEAIRMDLKEKVLGVRELGVSDSREGPLAGYGEHGSGSEGFYKQRGIS
jgi:hypothetical protein